MELKPQINHISDYIREPTFSSTVKEFSSNYNGIMDEIKYIDSVQTPKNVKTIMIRETWITKIPEE